MHKTDLGDTLSRPIRDLRAALSLLTRLPLPAPKDFPTPPAVWAWPLAGLVVGALTAGAGMAALTLGLPPALAAAMVLAMGCITTGALHEDGLADTADGLWGGWDKARRLEIMKDSRVGSYGVLALGLVLLARWAALTALVEGGHWGALIAAEALSRAAMAGVMTGLPNARGRGLSASHGAPEGQTAAIAGALALGLAGMLAGWAAPAMAIAALAAAAGVGAVARAKIGGQTGDVLGAAQQMALVAALAMA